MTRIKARLLGLGANMAILALVVGAPAILLAIQALPTAQSFTWAALANPDDGSLALAVIAVVAWLSWLVVAASLILSGISRLRGVRAPRIPGLGVPQVAADRLVAAAALLFIAVPVAARTPLPSAEAQTPAEPPIAVSETPSVSTTPQVERVETVEDRLPVTERYQVRRGDSLWKIAHERLGDGARYTEIVALNPDTLRGRADFITPGLDLRVPVAEAGPNESATETIVVEEGDTLSAIAKNELGDARAYPDIVEASLDTVQPDGGRLTDPDLIRPGWTLTMPAKDAPPPAPAPPSPPDREPPPLPLQPERRAPAPSRAAAENDAGVAESTFPEWVLPGLTGAGAMLTGALLLVLRQHRKTQQRYRRPGNRIAPPPSTTRSVERTARLVGSVTGSYVASLNATLRALGADADPLPCVQTATIADGQVHLELAKDSVLPEPWHGSGTTWAAALNSETDADGLWPYPLLVAIGQNDDGHPVLLNLEELAAMTVVGDVERVAAFARFITAELALNPWSALVEVDVFGVGSELADLNPSRLRYRHERASGSLSHLENELAQDRPADADLDQFHVVLAGEDSLDDLRRISSLIKRRPARTGAAAIALSADPEPDDVVIELTNTGRLLIPALELDIVAAGLTSEEASACTAIVDVTRDAENAPIPVDDQATGPAAYADSAGALRSEFTEPRPSGPAGSAALLPKATEDYTASAATTGQDVESLAPVTSPNAPERVDEADPDLDQDLARWRDPDAHVPKLTLLGPVNARAYGGGTTVPKRKPYYVELLAYLLLHPEGVTAQQVADAMAIRTERAHTDLSVVRAWLGHDATSGTRYLPPARSSKSNGRSVYRVEGVLCDLDLFRRLRTRGQGRGENGIGDLVTALGLVSGEPFSNLRPAGWNWLLDGERIDHIMTCAVVDVGHIVTTHALATGDLELARTASETAYEAVPDDDISTLDLIEVAKASGHLGLAERMLAERVHNRSDDGLAPVALPPRTEQVAENHDAARAIRTSDTDSTQNSPKERG